MVDLKRDLYFKSEFVNPTQLLINYLDAVGGRAEYNNLFLALSKIENFLNKKNIRTNLVFRGCRSDGNIRGETISNELWYWISNGFIKEVYERDKNYGDKAKENIIILEFTEKARNLLSHENIKSQINWNLPDSTEKILKDAISSAISNVFEK